MIQHITRQYTKGKYTIIWGRYIDSDDWLWKEYVNMRETLDDGRYINYPQRPLVTVQDYALDKPISLKPKIPSQKSLKQYLEDYLSSKQYTKC